MEITKEELFKKGTELFGDNKDEWKFQCSGCGMIQSVSSIRENAKNGIYSQRFGEPKKGDYIHVESSCYSPDCNWVSNGLFHSGILVILDPKKTHDSNLKKNCFYIFPFAGGMK